MFFLELDIFKYSSLIIVEGEPLKDDFSVPKLGIGTKDGEKNKNQRMQMLKELNSNLDPLFVAKDSEISRYYLDTYNIGICI